MIGENFHQIYSSMGWGLETLRQSSSQFDEMYVAIRTHICFEKNEGKFSEKVREAMFGWEIKMGRFDPFL